MQFGRSTGWVLLSLIVAVLGVGSGWIAAWKVDQRAATHWEALAVEEAADVTEALAVALERAESQLLAFSHSLPRDTSLRSDDLNAAFAFEATALNLLGGTGPFRELAYAAWVPGQGRSVFATMQGVDILAPDGTPSLKVTEAFVTLHHKGAGDNLFHGLDLAEDSRLAPTVKDGYRANDMPFTGPSFQSGDRRLTPIAIRHGDDRVVLGIVDLTDLLDAALAVTLTEGLSVRVEERAAAALSSEAALAYDSGEGYPALLEWETRYAQSGVGWRFVWSADSRFRGGISTELGDGLRIGSVILSLMIAAILGLADGMRRRQDDLSRERAMMQTTVQRMAEGLSIVDQDLNVVAANDYFYDIYAVPDAMRHGGQSVESLTRLRLERGDFGPVEDPEEFVEERMAFFRTTSDSIVEDYLPNGRNVEIRRMRTPDGLLVSLHLDVTERRKAEKERAASAALISTTFEHMSDGLSAVDRHGALLNWNSRFLEFFGLTSEDVEAGRSLDSVLQDALSTEDLTTLSKAFAQIEWRTDDGATEGAADSVVVLRLSDGRWLQLSHRPIPERGFVITYADVTDRMRMTEALSRSEERYALAAAGANDGLWDWDLTQDRLYTSPRWREMLGLGRDTLSEQPDEWFNRVHPSDVEDLEQALHEHLSGRTDHLYTEFRVLHAEGAYLWTVARALAVRDDMGQATRLTGSLTDITERKRAEEKLLRDALYDTVTGLPNRALFLDRLEQERRRHKDPGLDTFAVLLLDLDRFKVVNDSLGHDLGDTLLIEVARRLESSIKPGDSVARLSGDEFGILLTSIEGAEQAQDMVHWLQADISAAFMIGNQEVFTSASIGIAMPSQGFADSEEMLRAADIAMYKAKEKGQSSSAIFDPQMQSRAITQMQLENDLRRAVDRGEIEMYYQPIISFRTGRIAGVEALARWRHPDRGTVVPADFIPLAEDTGLITTIGTTALRLACRQMKSWERDLGELAPETMSVNLSSRQLQDPDMVREIELILAREDIKGSRLKLEVTESMIMMNPETTSRILFDLKELGVALSIDDFGTGYSSLSYLHRFPFDTLKIDRSFVVSMEDKTENMEIIRSIALLAHNLGMDIIAEGVETDRHMRRLNELNCEFGQGYYFASPLPAERITELIRDGQSWITRAVG